jgi:hypothetical protein
LKAGKAVHPVSFNPSMSTLPFTMRISAVSQYCKFLPERYPADRNCCAAIVIEPKKAFDEILYTNGSAATFARIIML